MTRGRKDAEGSAAVRVHNPLAQSAASFHFQASRDISAALAGATSGPLPQGHSPPAPSDGSTPGPFQAATQQQQQYLQGATESSGQLLASRGSPGSTASEGLTFPWGAPPVEGGTAAAPESVLQKQAARQHTVHFDE